jgi:hypothetical protein
MAIYRLSRNSEASLLDFISTELEKDGWVGINVLKGFPQEYKGKTPFIGIEALNRPIARKELGTDKIYDDVIITIRIFATSDGMRLDLSDWLISKLILGMDYYNYTIVNGVINSKVLSGRINTLKITDNRKELTNTENLETEDRYRQLIICQCRIALS